MINVYSRRRKLSNDAVKTSKLLSVLVLTVILFLSVGSVTRAQGPPLPVTFDQSGVGGDFTGTVVTVDGNDSLRASDLPKTYSFDNLSDHLFVFQTQLSVNSNKRYFWASTTGEFLDEPELYFTVTHSETITGNYKTQWRVTFNQSGVGSDFTGPVLTVDGAGYSRNALPVNLWFDNGSSHSFTYNSPLLVAPAAKRYSWNTTSGLSTVQSGSITATGPGSITGEYKTQYYLNMIMQDGTGTALPGSGWHDAGSKLNISATPTPQYSFQCWFGIGISSYTGTKNQGSITMNGPVVEIAVMAKKKTLR